MQPIVARYESEVEISLPYADRQKPLSDSVFQIYRLDDNKMPLESVPISHLSVVDLLDDFSHEDVLYKKFKAVMKFAPKNTGLFQVFFVLNEYNRQYNRSGPIIEVINHGK